jgi:ComEC/Rec2-related protein
MAGICAPISCVHAAWLAALSFVIAHKAWKLATIFALGCGAYAMHTTLESLALFQTYAPQPITGTVVEKQDGMAIVRTQIGRLQLRTPHHTLQLADTVHISHAKLYPRTTQNSWYLLRRSLYATGSIPKKSVVTVTDHPTWSWRRTQDQWRNDISNQCQQILSPSTYTLFALLFLGKSEQTDLYETFAWWGISHHLARSGLHLVLFLMLLRTTLCLIPGRYEYKTILLMVLATMYGILSWSSISFLRAYCGCVAYCMYDLLWIPTSALHVVCLVTLAVLIYQPAQLFFLDFQLSFGLTWALAFLSHVRKILPAHKATF